MSQHHPPVPTIGLMRLPSIPRAISTCLHARNTRLPDERPVHLATTDRLEHPFVPSINVSGYNIVYPIPTDQDKSTKA